MKFRIKPEFIPHQIAFAGSCYAEPHEVVTVERIVGDKAIGVNGNGWGMIQMPARFLEGVEAYQEKNVNTKYLNK